MGDLAQRNNLAILGHLELRYLLARGGMADVYVAWDRSLNRTVVVKVLRHELAEDEIATERLRREAVALAAIQSPHVVGIHTIGTVGTSPYLVLQHVQGLTLEEEIRRFGPVASPRACRLALDMLAGLSAVHARNFVHRDLKPSNVIIDLDDRAVLLDLGIALHRRRRSLTPAGLATGTPQFMAPEALEASGIDARTDLYQIGMLLIYLVTGQELDRDNGHATLARLPRILLDIALRALAPIGGRYRDTAEMAAALAGALPALDCGFPIIARVPTPRTLMPRTITEEGSGPIAPTRTFRLARSR